MKDFMNEFMTGLSKSMVIGIPVLIVAIIVALSGCDGFRIPIVVEGVMLEAKAQALAIGTDNARAKCLAKTPAETWKQDVCLLAVKLAECPEKACPECATCPDPVECPEIKPAPVVDAEK
jgi:hypothetical protein